MRPSFAVLVALNFSGGCHREVGRVAPAPEGDARVIDNSPACLRQETCGQWQGCVLAHPQSLPFVATPGDTPITTGSWYRFDWSDRKNEVGQRHDLCVGDAGRCFEALQHRIACLPVFNLVEPNYRCEMLAGECRKVE